jgi:flagellar basal-body rod protein FlgB
MKKIIIFLSVIISSLGFCQTIDDLNNELKYMTTREMVLSQNLANIDTPGYKPRDIKKKNGPRNHISLTLTHRGHIALDQNLDYDSVQGEIIEMKPNGNCVTAENELAKKNENAIRFTKTANMINSIIGMTKMSIGE